MIKYPRNLSIEELADWLTENAPLSAIVNTCATLLKEQEKEKSAVIVVDPEEYERIMGLFKIRGLRTSEGNVIKETRGRKPKDRKTSI